MKRIEALRAIKTKHELALLLGIKTSELTYVLYKLKPSSQYVSFPISKKNGGTRTIWAPSERLKSLQSRLSSLLQDCIDDINKSKKEDGKFKSTLAHGFVRERSIITNAMMHLHKKSVLNIDLKDFFDGFNFGRVRGFFISNKNFTLDPHIATVIAQIACHNNKLPQGSPCSPVISNLITHSLDIRLASLAKRHSCTYSRYADDITISTREAIFPLRVMSINENKYIAGKKLKDEIHRAGFELNDKKTRIQYKDSRQDVTGLVVNKKPNVRSEYWRTVRSQCHALFSTGAFTKKINGSHVSGNIYELEGQLNFIDHIDHYNRLRQKPPFTPEYELANHGHNTNKLLSSRERTFSRFLYYRFFYGNNKPTILCEGKTDNIYMKSAISRLASSYPNLAKPGAIHSPYELLVDFLKYSGRTRFLLQLHGGSSYLSHYISAFDRRYNFYKAQPPKSPVVIIADNDSGFKAISLQLNKIASATSYPNTLAKNDFRESDFIHVIHNLYIVLTPLNAGQETAIEDLFDASTRKILISGKSFNPKNNCDTATEYGKEIFAKKVIQSQKSSINFDGLKPLLDRITKAINHYSSII